MDLWHGAGNSAASRGAIAGPSARSRAKSWLPWGFPRLLLENRTPGLAGTEGRECLRRGKIGANGRSVAARGCVESVVWLWRNARAETVSSCNCKFHWCCAVKASSAGKTVPKYYCVQRTKRVKNDSASHRKAIG